VRLSAALVAAVAIASCATPDHSLPEIYPLAGIVTGSEASMVRFEAAARQCGAQVFSIDRGREPRWIGIGRTLEPFADDPQIDCAISWMLNHREEELYFVGNAPRE